MRRRSVGRARAGEGSDGIKRFGRTVSAPARSISDVLVVLSDLVGTQALEYKARRRDVYTPAYAMAAVFCTVSSSIFALGCVLSSRSVDVNEGRAVPSACT